MLMNARKSRGLPYWPPGLNIDSTVGRHWGAQACILQGFADIGLWNDAIAVDIKREEQALLARFGEISGLAKNLPQWSDCSNLPIDDWLRYIQFFQTGDKIFNQIVEVRCI